MNRRFDGKEAGVRQECSPAAEYIAGLVIAPAVELTQYDVTGAKQQRKQTGDARRFRPPTGADEERFPRRTGAG
jgi:hypothetical protein